MMAVEIVCEVSMRRIAAAMLLAAAVIPSAQADEPVTAKTILDQALTDAQSIMAPAERTPLLVAIGHAQIATGDRLAASATLDQALAAAKTIDNSGDQAASLAAIVAAALE